MSTPKCDDACGVAVVPAIIIGISNISVLNLQQGSLITFTVPPERMGMAFGLLSCAFNTGYTVFPPILGAAKDSGGTNAAFFILFMLAVWSLVMTIFMYYTDRKYNNGILQAKNP